MALGGGASLAAGISKVGSDPSLSDPSTWRWRVSSILDEQKKSSATADLARAVEGSAFVQRHERYSPLGLPEKGRPSP
jgi:hypothetical protein